MRPASWVGLALALCVGCGPTVVAKPDHPTILPPLAAAPAPTWPPAGFSPVAQAMTLDGLPVFPTCPTFTWQLVTQKVWLSTPSAADPPALAGSLPFQPTPAPTYTWTCTTPLPDGTYYLSLSSVNAEGTESARSVPVGFVVGSPTPPPTVIGIGSPIFVNTALGVVLNVRAAPGGTVIGTQARGATGTVTGGPTVIGAVTWWQITYTNAPSGWSNATYLSLTAP